MKLHVLSFNLSPGKTKLAEVAVRYENLILRCDIVYHPTDKKIWVRMPEIWVTATVKHQFAFWPSKELSDEFQVEVLKKIDENFSFSNDKLVEFYHVNVKNRKYAKKNRPNQ